MSAQQPPSALESEQGDSSEGFTIPGYRKVGKARYKKQRVGHTTERATIVCYLLVLHSRSLTCYL